MVSSAVYASLEPVERSHSFQLAVVLQIRPGFHINSRHPSEKYLIPTDLVTGFPAGFKPDEIFYPQGTLQTFSFSKTPLSVYQDKAILRVPVSVLPDAPLGEQHLSLSNCVIRRAARRFVLPPVTVKFRSAGDGLRNRQKFPPSSPGTFSRFIASSLVTTHMHKPIYLHKWPYILLGSDPRFVDCCGGNVVCPSRMAPWTSASALGWWRS